MRFRLLRRRLSISASRVIVRSRLPWPLRWALAALALGFSAAIALWAFEFGKDIAGLDRSARAELAQLRDELGALREEAARAQAIAATADSLLTAERAAQERLAAQLKQAEAENMALKADLGFFERLLPVSGGGAEGLVVRGFQAERSAPGELRYQLLVMRSGKSTQPFDGHYELRLAGTLDGRPWTAGLDGGARALQVRQYARLEGRVPHPTTAVVKSVEVRVLSAAGAVLATQKAAL